MGDLGKGQKNVSEWSGLLSQSYSMEVFWKHCPLKQIGLFDVGCPVVRASKEHRNLKITDMGSQYKHYARVEVVTDDM